MAQRRRLARWLDGHGKRAETDGVARLPHVDEPYPLLFLLAVVSDGLLGGHHELPARSGRVVCV